jgi:hypothetical protein
MNDTGCRSGAPQRSIGLRLRLPRGQVTVRLDLLGEHTVFQMVEKKTSVERQAGLPNAKRIRTEIVELSTHLRKPLIRQGTLQRRAKDTVSKIVAWHDITQRSKPYGPCQGSTIAAVRNPPISRKPRYGELDALPRRDLHATSDLPQRGVPNIAKRIEMLLAQPTIPSNCDIVMVVAIHRTDRQSVHP